MSGDDSACEGRGIDDRVSTSDQISLRRDPELGDALVTGPYPYSRSEQDAWLDAAKDAIRQYQRETRPEIIFTNLKTLAGQTNDGLTIESDGTDLLVRGDELDVRVRLGIRGGSMYVEEESVDDDGDD